MTRKNKDKKEKAAILKKKKKGNESGTSRSSLKEFKVL
jgi:hypothetical protein